MIETGPELRQLFLRDALGVAGQNLVLHLVDVAVDRCEQLFPADAQRFHCVLRVAILEDHRLLHGLVNLFQFFDVWLVGVNGLFVFPETVQLILQRPLQSHADGRNGIHLSFDPRSHRVGLFGELTAKHFVVLLFAQFVGQCLVALWHQRTHLRPFAGQIVRTDRCVRILQSAGDLVLVHNALHFAYKSHDDIVLLVGFAEGGLELVMGVHEALDFLHGVDDEHVDQIFAGAIQPVVEWSRTLGELQVEDVDLFENALGIVEGLTTALGEGSQAVPLVADALATRVYRCAIVVLKGTAERERERD